jgi:hypothetical protein
MTGRTESGNILAMDSLKHFTHSVNRITQDNNPLWQETSGHSTEMAISWSRTQTVPTQNNERYRLRQETSGHRGRLTENGNIVVSDTEGATQNNVEDVEARSCARDLSHLSAHRPWDPQTSKLQANQRESPVSPLPVLDGRALRSFQLPWQEYRSFVC